jgi:predicted RNA-binding Zn-ribbon protein involved in translation (DUF1610 family)
MASTMAANTMQEMSSHGDDTVMVCPHCGESNDVFSKRCSRCHGDFKQHDGAVDAPEEAAAPHSSLAGLVFFVSLLVVAGLAVGVFYWLT